MHTVYYTGEFKPVERSTRMLDKIVDIWLRRNPMKKETEDGIQNIAEEVYLAFNIDEAPSQEELENNFDKWFSYIEEKTSGKTPQEIQIEELNSLINILLGVNENA